MHTHRSGRRSAETLALEPQQREHLREIHQALGLAALIVGQCRATVLLVEQLIETMRDMEKGR